MALVGLPVKTLVDRLEAAEKEVIGLRIKNKILIDRLAELSKSAATPTFEAAENNVKAKKK